MTKSNAEFPETGVRWMTCVPASCAVDDACRFLVFVILTCLDADGGNIPRQIASVPTETTLSVHKALNDWKPL